MPDSVLKAHFVLSHNNFADYAGLPTAPEGRRIVVVSFEEDVGARGRNAARDHLAPLPCSTIYR
jgi:hypothetical protein